MDVLVTTKRSDFNLNDKLNKMINSNNVKKKQIIYYVRRRTVSNEKDGLEILEE